MFNRRLVWLFQRGWIWWCHWNSAKKPQECSPPAPLMNDSIPWPNLIFSSAGSVPQSQESRLLEGKLKCLRFLSWVSKVGKSASCDWCFKKGVVNGSLWNDRSFHHVLGQLLFPWMSWGCFLRCAVTPSHPEPSRYKMASASASGAFDCNSPCLRTFWGFLDLRSLTCQDSLTKPKCWGEVSGLVANTWRPIFETPSVSRNAIART